MLLKTRRRSAQTIHDIILILLLPEESILRVVYDCLITVDVHQVKTIKCLYIYYNEV